MLIDVRTIIATIKQVDYPLYLCDRKIIQEANLRHAIPRQVLMRCKRVRGYAVNSPPSIYAKGGRLDDKNSFNAYILSQDIGQKEEEIASTSFLVADGMAYQIELVEAIYHQGVKLIHKFNLQETEERVPITQPDSVIRSNPGTKVEPVKQIAAPSSPSNFPEFKF